MRIEEKCGCGAGLTLVVDDKLDYGVTAAMATGNVRDAWHQVDRWRKLHAGCRSSVNGPIYAAGEPGKGDE